MFPSLVKFYHQHFLLPSIFPVYSPIMFCSWRLNESAGSNKTIPQLYFPWVLGKYKNKWFKGNSPIFSSIFLCIKIFQHSNYLRSVIWLGIELHCICDPSNNVVAGIFHAKYNIFDSCILTSLSLNSNLSYFYDPRVGIMPMATCIKIDPFLVLFPLPLWETEVYASKQAFQYLYYSIVG